MRASTTFSILALLAAAQAAPPGDSCGRHRARPSHSRPGVSASSEYESPPFNPSGDESAEPTLPTAAESDVGASSTDSSTTTILTTDTVTETGSPTGAAESEAAVTTAEPSVISTPPDVPSSAESSVVETSVAADESTIGGDLAVPTPPTPSDTSASVSTSVSGTAAPSPSATASNPGEVKVGLAVNGDTGPLSNFVGGNSKAAWYYNWALDANTDSAGLEYVPMVWGEQSVADVSASAQKWNAQGVTHVLSFNEPDMPLSVGGSDMDPALAAMLHKQWTSSLPMYLIGSPAVARGSKKWMDDWLAACNDECVFDFVPFHFYGTDVNQLMDYVDDFAATYNKPLWLTEWACHDYTTGEICDEAKVEEFMKTAIAYFRQSGLVLVRRVPRYGQVGRLNLSPCICSKRSADTATSNGNPNGLQNTDGSVNAVGTLYLQA